MLPLLTVLLTLLYLPGLVHAAAPPCQARTGAPCVHLDFDPLPPDLPALLTPTAHAWLTADPSGTDYHYASPAALHRQLETAWHQTYPDQPGPQWTLRRRLRYSHATTPPWRSLLLVERRYFGGAHGNYRVRSVTLDAAGAPVSWTTLARLYLPPQPAQWLPQALHAHYPTFDPSWSDTPLVPPDAWIVTPRGVELWWEPYRLGSFALDPRGPPRLSLSLGAPPLW